MNMTVMRNIYKQWKNWEYRNEQLQKLSSKITLIEPHRPQYGNLVVVGKKVTEQERPTCSKDFLLKGETNIKPLVQCVSVSPVPSLRFTINDHVLTKGDQLVNDTLKISLIFESYRGEENPVVHYLIFENKGLSTLRFYWRQIEKFRIFRDLIKRERGDCHPFYFTKSELLLPPRKTTKFPIWFKANDVGNYSECWEITTQPAFWGNDYHLIISLQGFVFIKDFEEATNNLKARLDDNVRNTLIADLLLDICNPLKYSKTQETIWHFTEKQLFESANQEMWGVEKRSKYMYNAAVVGELKQFYKEVKLPDNPINWNYSVKELKILTRKKDIVDYVEEKTNEAKKARERRQELQTILKEQIEMSIAQKKTDASAKSKKVPPLKNVGEEDAFLIKETRCNKLEIILRQLERPLMIKNTNREKYFTAYTIMGMYMHKMCNALENISKEENLFADNNFPTYSYEKVTSLDKMPGRLLFENFDDIWVEKIKRVPPDGRIEYPELPKPERLQDIPLEDTKTRYKRYFNLPDTPPETKKGKGGKDKDKGKGASKDKSSDTKSKKGEGKSKVPVKVLTVKEGFNPYAEEYFSPPRSLCVPCPSTRKYAKKTAYDYQKYLIVYFNLYDAIGAIVDALEMFKENIVPVDMLGGLAKCTEINIKEDVASISSKPEASATSVVSRSCEDNEYFQYLLDSHLNKNLNTKKYLVHGKTKPIDQLFEDESQEPESLVNVFKSSISIEDNFAEDETASVEIQTSDVHEEYKTFSNILLQDEPAGEMESESSVEDTYSREIFYYLGRDDDYIEVSEERHSGDSLA